MKKILLNFLKPFIKAKIENLINNGKYKKEVIARINSKINIPTMDEATEEKLISDIVNAIQAQAIELIDRV